MTLEAAVGVRLGALDLDVELAIPAGEIVAMLGPNGAGKTTLLRALAGLIPIEKGFVRLDGRVLEDSATRTYVPTEKRPIGFVFQDYLLFPHMSVLDNVAFGVHDMAPARAWVERVGLRGYEAARPSQLSGGQRQRAALARALARDPRLLLLDEPMAALDVSARTEVRRDLKKHLSSFPGVRLLVTHDPLEAVALADRLIVVERGRLVQSGTPEEVTERPRSPYVADLVGVNLMRGDANNGSIKTASGHVIAAADAVSGAVFAVIHPRAVALHRARPEGSPRNVWSGRADAIEITGDRARVRVIGPVPVVAEVTPASLSELRLVEGSEVWISFKATDVRVYPE